jgi:spermidine synthase
MVTSSFPWFRQSGRDDPDPRAALRVDDGKEVVLDHAEQDIAILAVILPPVLTYHGERVIEGQASCLEAYAVIGQILGGLGVLPC